MKKENAAVVTLENRKPEMDTLTLIRQYLETTIRQLHKQVAGKDLEIKQLKTQLAESQNMLLANQQLFNKLLEDLTKLNNDIDWYKKTYEQRSFLGTVREKLFRRHSR
jgi:peptidoglycan hydrolase CwlO-like protein